LACSIGGAFAWAREQGVGAFWIDTEPVFDFEGFGTAWGDDAEGYCQLFVENGREHHNGC
jgi:hypothetical protein